MGASAGLAALHLLNAAAAAAAAAGFPWVAGRCRIAGRRKYVPGGLAAASCRGHPDTARPRHIPATAGGCRPWSTHWSDIEWNSGDRSVFQRKADLTPRRPSSSRETVEGGVGPVAGVSAAWMPRPSPEGHFRDGFTASPPPDPPAIPQKPAFDVDVALASAGAGRSPAENPYLNRPFCARSQPSVRLDRSAAAVRFPPGPPATRVRPLRPPHSDAVRHAFQPALRAGCQLSQRGSRDALRVSRSL